MSKQMWAMVSVLFALAAGAMGANQYWDTSGSTGIQGGNGNWSTTDSYWSTAPTGTALSVWTAGNSAWFVMPSNGAASVVTVNGNSMKTSNSGKQRGTR